MGKITVTTPPGVAGPADVKVTKPDGRSAVFTGGFTYNATPLPDPKIDSVSPGNGPEGGGTQIVVAGTNIDPGDLVTIDGIVAPEPEPIIVPDIWPDNEPAGLVPVFPGHPTRPGVLIDGSDLYLDYTAQGGENLGRPFFFGRKWDGVRILSTTSAGSRYANVIRKNFLVGDVAGWNGIASDDEWAADYEALYFRMIFKYSANWQFNGATDKLWYWGEADSGGNDFWIGIQNTPLGKVLTLVNQAGGGGDTGEWRSSTIIHNPPSLDFRAAWHTVELIVNAQSALGVADGSFRMLLDGVEVTDFNWLKASADPGQNAIQWYGPGHNTRLLSGLQSFLHWGGSSGTKTVNDHIDISELYVAGREAVA